MHHTNNHHILRVDAEWLNANLQKQHLLVLDARVADDYDVEHISGAISFPESLTYQQKSGDGRIVEPNVIQQLLRERGVKQDSFIVVYDDGALLNAARVFWALEVYGIKEIRILDQGYERWTSMRFPVSQHAPSISPSQFVPTVDNRRIASKFATQLATRNPKQHVIDARTSDAYKGETSSAKRFGHIPKAINIPVFQNFRKTANGVSLRSANELQSLYSALSKDEKIIVYCSLGRVSSTNYFALRELGYDVANYDASWNEWGNDDTLPIDK